jgi:hypothetical protein
MKLDIQAYQRVDVRRVGFADEVHAWSLSQGSQSEWWM